MQAPPLLPDSYQQNFERRWGHLRNPHVRDLAWLLDSPGLLDSEAEQWEGKIALFSSQQIEQAAPWLGELDRDPSALMKVLNIQPLTRLGRYAERLLSYYFQHAGILAAEGVQVRAAMGETLGEFDFLLRQPEGLVHWELATKFYLLEPSGTGREADYFVGPNRADTLGKKMRKIFSQQLLLKDHPTAREFVPDTIVRAEALVKGWLFYQGHGEPAPTLGVASDHCRGFWCELAEFAAWPIEHAVILPRLSWLAPARVEVDTLLDRVSLLQWLQDYFQTERMPVLIGLMNLQEDGAIEYRRGFVVPDNWA